MTKTTKAESRKAPTAQNKSERLVYIRYSKQSYWPNDTQDITRDDITVTKTAIGGLLSWEFSIRQHILNGRPEISVGVFGDAMNAFGDQRVVRALTALHGLTRLDQVEDVLKANNIRPEVR